MPKTRLERFSEKYIINKETNCWEWTGNISSNGYGIFHWGTKLDGGDINIVAHRAAWLLLKGEIPEDRMLRHQCHNKKCCNPEHVKLGTHLENMRDRDIAGRTAKGENHYKFKRTGKLIEAFRKLREQNMSVEQICKSLGCGRNTFYRAVARDIELKEINKKALHNVYSEARANLAISNPQSFARGEKCKQSKVTCEDVKWIRKQREAGSSLLQLANKFGMSEVAISNICLGKTWRHV